jgi:type IV pilus assembly protein PilE
MRERGFTLIEVIIAMVIIGILTAIAIPNYMAYIQRSRRAEARAALVEAAVWMERWRTERGRYDDPASPGNPPPTFAAAWPQVPRTGAAHYNIAVAAAAGTYTITVTAVGVMAADDCATIVINNTGQRTFTGANATMQKCWDITGT